MFHNIINMYIYSKHQLCPGEERRGAKGQDQTQVFLTMLKRKQWTYEAMQAAVSAVKEDQVTIIHAS